jgi:acetolactate synthase-1/3 small subunit
MRHTISIILQNEAGALTRVAGLFSSRGYNIESLHVAPTQDNTVSRLTLVTIGSDEVIQQICNQLLKLVDVVNLVDMTEGKHFERELMLLKARLDEKSGKEFNELLEIAGARTLDDRPGSYTLELTASGPELDRFVDKVKRFAEVVTVVRSGTMAVAHGTVSLEHPELEAQPS